jgi:hypothetical protein
MSVMIASQYSPLNIIESKYSQQIEPDQEVAAVLYAGNPTNLPIFTMFLTDSLSTCSADRMLVIPAMFSTISLSFSNDCTVGPVHV